MMADPLLFKKRILIEEEIVHKSKKRLFGGSILTYDVLTRLLKRCII